MSRAHTALVDAEPSVFWLADPARPEALPPLTGRVEADLVVVGGGYTGLWTALRAVERDPSRSVVLLEAGVCGDEASGRNGGFAAATLTHGFGNGLARWPDELATLDRLGAENLRGIAETVERHAIDCHWEETGELAVATEPHQLAELEELATAMSEAGHDVELLDAAAVRARDARRRTSGGWRTRAARLWWSRHGSRGGCAGPASSSAW
jgi:glycine/D-amino acid oxidase-like deaminating enzyme